MAEKLAAEMESNWIEQAQAGDLGAFEQIVKQHRQGMINVVYRMCGDPVLAEDAAQIAFVKAWMNLGRYRRDKSLRAWLYRIAVNSAFDMLRKEKRMVDWDEKLAESKAQAQSEDPKMLLEKKERQEKVRRAVLDLPEASRSVLVLREYEGLSYQEIADSLEIPLGTVMSRLSYARKRLSESLRPYMESA